MAQAVERLLYKYKVVSSNPSPTKKKKMEVGASLLCRGQALVSWLHDSLSLSLPLMQCRAHLLSSHRVDGIAHRIFT
jgi:hypothetical protein